MTFLDVSYFFIFKIDLYGLRVFGVVRLCFKGEEISFAQGIQVEPVMCDCCNIRDERQSIVRNERGQELEAVRLHFPLCHGQHIQGIFLQGLVHLPKLQ